MDSVKERVIDAGDEDQDLPESDVALALPELSRREGARIGIGSVGRRRGPSCGACIAAGGNRSASTSVGHGGANGGRARTAGKFCAESGYASQLMQVSLYKDDRTFIMSSWMTTNGCPNGVGRYGWRVSLSSSQPTSAVLSSRLALFQSSFWRHLAQ